MGCVLSSRPEWSYCPRGVPGPTGSTGSTGSIGLTGVTGIRGSLWYTGSGAPGAIAGIQNGDWYLDTSSADVWEVLLGAFSLQGNIAGSSNLDGGKSDTIYGGSNAVNGGTA